MKKILAVLCLPLVVIAVQRWLGFHGIQSSLYKLFMLVPPILYCRAHGIGVTADILRFQNWRNRLSVSLALGLLGAAIFWAAYLWLGDALLDKPKIARSVSQIFVTNAGTVWFVAPVTVFLNSLLEEFFYRGFAFGLLVRRHRGVGIVAPAVVFTVQHVLFFWQWMAWIPFLIAVLGLLVFALVVQWLYEKADTIVAPWVVHMLGDLALMTIAVRLFHFEVPLTTEP
jgi:membrane protease YdiL (CAAX protease family)